MKKGTKITALAAIVLTLTLLCTFIPGVFADEPTLPDAKAAAIIDLGSYKPAANYVGLGKAGYDAVIEKYTKRINDAADADAVSAALNAGKAELDTLPTDSELNALKDAKDSALAAVAAYGSNLESYSKNQQEEITSTVNSYSTSISAATSEAAISALKNEAIGKLQKIPTYADQKAAAAELSAYMEMLQSTNEYPQSAKTEFTTIFNGANYAIFTVSAGTTKEDLANLVITFKTQMDGVGTVFRESQKAAIKELNEYLDRTQYRAEQLEEIDGIIADYTEKINNATVEEYIVSWLAEGKSELDKVKKNIEFIKEEYCTQLDEYTAQKDLSLYYDEQAAELPGALKKAKDAVMEAADEDSALTAFNNGKKIIDAVKTKLAIYKDNALSELNGYKDKTLYSEMMQAKMASVIGKGALLIGNAKTESAVDSQLISSKADIDKIPTKADESAAKSVDNIINALPSLSRITLSNRDAVKAARSSYNNLSEVQKSCVNYYHDLADAEDKIAGFLSGAEKTVYLISRIGQKVDSYSQEVVEEARTAYDALNETQKAAVTNYAMLTNAEAILSGSDDDELWAKGDIDRSGRINSADLTLLLQNYGTADKDSDINSSGKVNSADLTLLLQNYGTQK